MISGILEAVSGYCKSNRIVFCRLNIPCPDNLFISLAPSMPPLHTLGNRVWTYWNSPRPIARVPLTGGTEDIIARMHRKARRNYRRSQECGVRVVRSSATALPAVARLMQGMGHRKQVLVRGEDHLRTLFNLYPAEDVALFVAEIAGEPAAFNFAICFARVVWVLYGCLDYEKRDVFPMEPVDVETLLWAHQKGCKECDLGGTCTSWPPKQTDKGYGVWHYKKNLGATAVLMAPYCDLVSIPPLYRAAMLAESAMLPLVLERGWGKVRVGLEGLRRELRWH